MQKQAKEELNYNCTWCGHKFKQEVAKLSRGKGVSASSQVVCPNCTNFIKTW